MTNSRDFLGPDSSTYIVKLCIQSNVLDSSGSADGLTHSPACTMEAESGHSFMSV